MRALVLLAVVVVVPAPGCLQIGTGLGAGADGGRPATADAGAADAGPTGAGCFHDPATGVQLCEQIDTCPTVAVDPSALPDCGFRLGAALDLECLCGDSLCPLGVPATCAQAEQLLRGQNQLLVCQQVSEGRCVRLASPDAGSGAAGATSPCDKQCESECAGDPSCTQLCGC
jgi:hypothetical protein